MLKGFIKGFIGFLVSGILLSAATLLTIFGIGFFTNIGKITAWISAKWVWFVGIPIGLVLVVLFCVVFYLIGDRLYPDENNNQVVTKE